ncbi:MAG: sigma-70 family RNA polymerase sigma factor [Verrucomicrobiota bacterium]
MNMTDSELLRRYVRDRSETAFGELVQRHINLVYSAALRQMNGDTHLAEDVTQSVFADLARKATRLIRHTSLTGWLYTSTRFVAANIRRMEQRRSLREREAHAMNAIISSTEPEPDWALIRPLLDEAMHSLDEQDREAVLLRHFENRSYAEIGTRFDLTENAARMRVERALEKLHGTLTKHGVTSTALAIAGLLTANAVGAAPAHLAAKVVRTALAGTATAGGLSVLLAQLLAVSKIKLAAAAVVLATVAALVVASRHTGPTASGTVAAGVITRNSVADVSPATTAPTNPVAIVPAVPLLTNGSILRLEIVAADSGKPIPMVPIEYRGWVNGKFEGKWFTSDRFGICDVIYPTNITELGLTTRKDDFADTRLLWRPPNGDVIPTNYILRVERPTAIGGRVVDADGKPVAGVKVGWNHEDDPTSLKLPQNHEFSWIEVTTDKDGRWRINRIAEDMIHRIYGGARDPEHVDSDTVFAGRNKTAEKQLRDGTHVFQLGRAVTVQGLVVDAEGLPIPDAKVSVGHIGESSLRNGKTQSDGTFSIPGCPPGKHLVSAEAPGYAATTVEADLAVDAGPIRLTLRPGKTLRLQVVDKAGSPVSTAHLWLNTFERGRIDSNRPKPVQVEYNSQTDHRGRVVWTNAPDAELTFDVRASGFMRVDGVKIHPDGEEHVITLPSALVVHGVVWDAATGRRIPRFRIVQGWPGRNPVEGTTNVQWSTIGRLWLEFVNGAYTNSFEEAVWSSTEIRGCMLKFMADGYAPFISRAIGPDEGDVQLDVVLHRAAATVVTVNKPDGQPASDADVGLVSPGAHLWLTQGGFNRQNVQSGGSLLRTKADGTFELPPDDSITRVMVASPDGYAEAVPTALSANPVLQLQPWGQLQVACFSGGKPAVGREYELELGGGSPDTVSFDFGMTRVKTDERGQFSVSQLPPGKHQLVRLILVKVTGSGSQGRMQGDKTPFEIRPGETTTLNLGTSTYTVTGRLQWPPGVQRQSQWHIDVSLYTPMPAMSPEVMTNAAALAAFLQTDEFKAAQQNMHSYQATINDDDTVLADEVPAGDYMFGVAVFEVLPGNSSGGTVSRFKNFFQSTVKLTIPANPPSGNLDAGVIELQAASFPP